MVVVLSGVVLLTLTKFGNKIINGNSEITDILRMRPLIGQDGWTVLIRTRVWYSVKLGRLPLIIKQVESAAVKLKRAV